GMPVAAPRIADRRISNQRALRDRMEHLAPGKEGPTRNLSTCRWLTNVSANHQVILWELIRERVALTKWETVSGGWQSLLRWCDLLHIHAFIGSYIYMGKRREFVELHTAMVSELTA